MFYHYTHLSTTEGCHRFYTVPPPPPPPPTSSPPPLPTPHTPESQSAAYGSFCLHHHAPSPYTGVSVLMCSSSAQHFGLARTLSHLVTRLKVSPGLVIVFLFVRLLGVFFVCFVLLCFVCLFVLFWWWWWLLLLLLLLLLLFVLVWGQLGFVYM